MFAFWGVCNTNESWARECIRYHLFSFLFLFPWIESWFYACLIFFVSTTNLPSHISKCSVEIYPGDFCSSLMRLLLGPTLLSYWGTSVLGTHITVCLWRIPCLYLCLLPHFVGNPMRKFAQKGNGLRICTCRSEFTLYSYLIVLLAKNKIIWW